MIRFVTLLMASVSAVPTQPSTAALTTYSGSLVQVNWTNSGAFETKVYRKLGAGSWDLMTTQAVAVTSYQTGDATSSGYVYGVSHYNPSNGGESAIRQATPAPPASPTSANTSLY